MQYLLFLMSDYVGLYQVVLGLSYINILLNGRRLRANGITVLLR